MGLIKDYLAIRKELKPEYLFGGHSRQAIYGLVKNALKLAGMPSSIPYAFRSTNLALTKGSPASYPTDWAELLVGHTVSTQGHYFDPDREAGKTWAEKVEPVLTFLSSDRLVQTSVEKMTAKAKELEKLTLAKVAEVEEAKRTIEALKNDMEKLKSAAQTQSPEAVLKTMRELLPEAQKRAEADLMETKRFENHVWFYMKTKMTNPDFDQALIEGWEIVLQSPDGYVLLRKPKGTGA